MSSTENTVEYLTGSFVKYLLTPPDNKKWDIMANEKSNDSTLDENYLIQLIIMILLLYTFHYIVLLLQLI